MESIENAKIVALVNVVFSFENKKGHLQWKVSEVARASKVSKALVYYYFGSKKEEILNACIKIAADEVYGLSESRNKLIPMGDMVASIKYTRQMFLNNYTFNAFYLHWRLSDTDIGRTLRDYDDRYQQKLASLFPHLSSVELVALHALIHGLVIAPVLDDDALKTALRWLPLTPKS